MIVVTLFDNACPLTDMHCLAQVECNYEDRFKDIFIWAHSIFLV